MTVYDAYGREMRIARGAWRESVLRPSLAKAWNDSDELYGLILTALDDGLAEDVEEASLRLLALDEIPERSHTIRGIVLMKTGRLDEAEAVLRAGIEEVGETGTLLTNLAKVHAWRGQDALADALSWQAVQRDPNQDNGLLWWAARQRERHGETGYVRALTRAAALEGSWRPQLLLARHSLETGDTAAARSLYDAVLAGGGDRGEALMTISGDLVSHGLTDLVPELVAPVFQPELHDPRVGFNLLQAYLELGRLQAGEELLDRLYALDLAPLKQHLDRYAAEFQEIGKQRLPPKPIEAPDQLLIETVAVEKPVWMYGLHDPDWLFASKPADAARITFLGFSRLSRGEGQAEEQREDTAGRLTRAVPLYLAEAAHFWTGLQARTLIPVVRGGGPVVFGAANDDDALWTSLTGETGSLVSGTIGDAADRWRLSYRLHDRASGSCLDQETIETTPDGIGAAVLELERRLLSRLGGLRSSPLDAFYVRPSEEAIDPYLAELGQSLLLTLLANGVVPTAGVWGERGMLEWPLHMALHWPGSEVPRLMYLSGLAKAAAYRSGVLHEFRTRTLALMDDARRTDGPATRLEPLVWALFGMTEELARHRQALPPDEPAGYGEWLARVAADPLLRAPAAVPRDP